MKTNVAGWLALTGCVLPVCFAQEPGFDPILDAYQTPPQAAPSSRLHQDSMILETSSPTVSAVAEPGLPETGEIRVREIVAKKPQPDGRFVPPVGAPPGSGVGPGLINPGPETRFHLSWLPLLTYVPRETPPEFAATPASRAKLAPSPAVIDRLLDDADADRLDLDDRGSAFPLRLKLDYNEDDPLESDVTEFGISGNRMGVTHDEDAEEFRIEFKTDW